MDFKLEVADVTEDAEPKKRNEHLAITATYDPNQNGWIVKFDGQRALNGLGASLSEAMHELANRLDALHLYGANASLVTHMRDRQKTKRCRWCSAKIWFAQTPNQKWMPIDQEPVEARYIQGNRALTITAAFDIAQTPVVAFVTKPQGTVWVPHFDVCGSAKEPPAATVLRDRWQTNRKGALAAKSAAIAGLRQITQDLEQEEVAA